MRWPFTSGDFAAAASELADLASEARRLEVELRAHCADVDGFPSGGLDRGRPSGVADPTGEAACAEPEQNEAGRTLIRGWNELLRARNEVKAVVGRFRETLRPPPKLPMPDMQVFCLIGERSQELRHPLGKWTRQGLCCWCYGFRAKYGQPPPPAILRKRHRFGRVSEQEIQQALGILDPTSEMRHSVRNL